MLTFKDVLAKDRAVFLNLGEFADVHDINGVKVTCLVDSNELLTRQQGRYLEGISTSQVLLYLKPEDLPKKPSIGSILRLDGEAYQVQEVSDEAGIWAITLDVARARR